MLHCVTKNVTPQKSNEKFFISNTQNLIFDLLGYTLVFIEKPGVF